MAWAVEAYVRPCDATWVCEWPQKYGHAEKYHDDIQTLWDVGDELGPWHVRYTPMQWKGNVPKHIHHQRILRTLTEAETGALRDRGHDALDAVGIGLFHLERTRRGGKRRRR